MLIVAAVSTGHTLTKVVADFVDEYKAEDAEFVTYNPISDADIEKNWSRITTSFLRMADIKILQQRKKDTVIP